MPKQAFTPNELARLIRPRDRERHPELNTEEGLASVTQDALAIAKSGFTQPIAHTTTVVRRKPIYRLKNISEELLLRKVAQNIRGLANLRQQDRNLIVKNLTRFLQEGVPYRIYRLDIHKFYERLAPKEILPRLPAFPLISRTTERLTSTFLERMSTINPHGVPRGLSISSILAEASLTVFDHQIKTREHVYFYARFVDDIIIITSGEESEQKTLSEISTLLPRRLELKRDPAKRYIESVPKAAKSGTETVLAKFEYLGYRFIVKTPPTGGDKAHQRENRPIEIQMSPNKKSRFKTRIIKSVLSFGENNDFALLKDRFRFLTGNYDIPHNTRNRKIRSGIYYNYKHLTCSGQEELKSLDRFLRTVLLTDSWPKVQSATSSLTAKQKRVLLQCNFYTGFKKRTHYRFSAQRIRTICRAWAYD